MGIGKSLTKMILLLPSLTFAGPQSIYCPQNSGYITIGMSEDEVIAACGKPLSKQESNQPIVKQVPVKQLIYNGQGDATAFYGVWALPIGKSNTGILQPFGGNSGGGAKLQVSIINDKVSSANINGSDTNAFTICNGVSIKIGDPANQVYGACGSPSLVNNTYINQIVPSNTKPQVWIYQPGQYQPAINLTFIDGQLQSID